MCHLCIGVRFAHAVYLPAVLATLDSFCSVSCHRLAVLKDGCVQAVLSRLNSQASPSTSMQQYGQRLITTLLWRRHGVIRDGVKEEPKKKLALGDASSEETIVVRSGVIREEGISRRAEETVERIGATGIIDESKTVQRPVDSNVRGEDDIRDKESERPELLDPPCEHISVVVSSDSVVTKKKSRRKKEVLAETTAPELAQPVLSESELRVLRKKERRSKQRSSVKPLVKQSLPRP